MADDPMITSPEVYSVNTFPGDGVTTLRNLNFSGGFISRDHIKAYTTGPDGTITIVAFAWTGPVQIEVTPPTPTGTTLTVYRDTPKSTPIVDFVNGSIINEANLDTLARQSVFTSAEMVDRFARFAIISQQALFLANSAVTIAAATVGGDFTKFARTDLPNTWTSAQNLLAGSQVGGVLIATQSYVTTSIASTLTAYSTTAAMAAADAAVQAAAATDAATKAGLAQSAASLDATSKVNAAIALIDPDWLYTLASR